MEPMKALAALLVLLLAGTSAAPGTCAGWEGSPESRRECCKRAHHASCQDQTAADNCCAGHEQGRLATVGPVADTAHMQPVAVVIPTFDPTSLHASARALYSMVIVKRLHAPPDLLVLPLRI
jgi:hypothetical protein